MKSKLKSSHSANMKKGNGDWHVSNTSMGMGDYYGTGIKNKVGRPRDISMESPVKGKKLKSPPLKLA